jgi:hypothetical protein
VTLCRFPVPAKIACCDPKAAEVAKVYPLMHEADQRAKEDFLNTFNYARVFQDAAAKGNAVILGRHDLLRPPR